MHTPSVRPSVRPSVCRSISLSLSLYLYTYLYVSFLHLWINHKYVRHIDKSLGMCCGIVPTLRALYPSFPSFHAARMWFFEEALRFQGLGDIYSCIQIDRNSCSHARNYVVGARNASREKLVRQAVRRPAKIMLTATCFEDLQNEALRFTSHAGPLTSNPLNPKS